ncbi:MAG TPA: CocE/NonD family hydrolase [Candidatus Polarisedimenticolia bacterium]|nr:CocE/NonD family hydrolase [Candidatus Polarisedimenticolia bacterium]
MSTGKQQPAPQQNEIIRKTQKFGNEEIEVAYQRAARRPPMGAPAAARLAKGELPTYVVDGFGDWPPLNPRTYEISDGIICEQDVAVPMRDGIITYCDIYRPATHTNIPAIIAWSPYGKRPCADSLQTEWQTLGVPRGSHSNYTKFEGPDPEFWCHQGYAIANYDPRGVGNSGGDIRMFSSQDGRDGYDLVEWLAKQSWCNGKIGMAGNSALAMAQWHIAAEHPPHLACIAPWEGTVDIYREILNMGGFTESGFNQMLISGLVGNGLVEDYFRMAQDYPLMNAYWEDKIAALEKIEVPTYLTVGWCHFHLRGATNAFRKINAKKKWMRTHRDFEWPDSYARESLDDLKRFFDRYLKGIRNGWESTPPVRIAVMDAYDFDCSANRPENEWPLARTQYRKLYLDAASRALSARPVTNESKITYDAQTGKATFDIAVDDETELTGYMKLRLWVEAEGSDDLDLFVAVQKLDSAGKWLPLLVLGKRHPGVPGKLRVSLRELDKEQSTEFQPVYPFRNPQMLKPGEIVPVEIEIWPTSRMWHRGEQLRVEVSGHYEREDWFEPFAWQTRNKGQHVIHSGGKYDSHLLVPYVPPKYVAGDYVRR